MPFRVVALTLLLVQAFTAAALAAETVPSLQWTALAVYRQREGLPQNSVYAIVQTRDGYLWIATKGGVARFDGVRFTVFDNRDLSQLRENEIWDLLEASD